MSLMVFFTSDGFHCYFCLEVLLEIRSLCHNSSSFLEKPTESYDNLYLTGWSEFRGTLYAALSDRFRDCSSELAVT